MKLEIKKIGNSTGLILPKELLARLGPSCVDDALITALANIEDDVPDYFALASFDEIFALLGDRADTLRAKMGEIENTS